MTRSARSGRAPRSASVDLRPDGQRGATDQLVLGSLMAAQLATAILGFSVLVGLLGSVVVSLLVIEATRPSLFDFRFAEVPIVWWVLGLLMFPLLLVVAAGYVRRVERLERRFRTLMRADNPLQPDSKSSAP
jgi:hypothetical protein